MTFVLDVVLVCVVGCKLDIHRFFNLRKAFNKECIGNTWHVCILGLGDNAKLVLKFMHVFDTRYGFGVRRSLYSEHVSNNGRGLVFALHQRHILNVKIVWAMGCVLTLRRISILKGTLNPRTIGGIVTEG